MASKEKAIKDLTEKNYILQSKLGEQPNISKYSEYEDNVQFVIEEKNETDKGN